VKQLSHHFARGSIVQQSDSQSYLRSPQLVRRSRLDDAVRLYDEFYTQTVVGGKWLCAVVKYAPTAPRQNCPGVGEVPLLARLGVADVRAFGLALED
jgi:hypothetical protein